MLDCAKLNKNNTLGSCRQGSGRLANSVIAINWSDWVAAEAASDITEASSVISAIALETGAYGYRLTSKEKGIVGSYSMNKGTYGNSMVHQLVINAFDRTQDNKNTMNKLLHGRYVFIVEHVDLNSHDTVYEVYGRQCGMTCSALDGDSSNADGVIAAITMASDDDARESEVPTSIYTTSLAATRTMVEALVSSN